MTIMNGTMDTAIISQQASGTRVDLELRMP